MPGDVKHHLMLRDQEVKLVLRALEQYEPREMPSSTPKGRCEQLARTIQKGCGITLDPHGEIPGQSMASDRPPSHSPVPEGDYRVSTDGGPPGEQ